MKFDEIDEFDEIIITFTDKNDTLLEIEDNFNLILLILKQKWRNILLKQEQENMVKNMDFYHLQKI